MREQIDMKPLPMSEVTRERLKLVSDMFKGKEMFPIMAAKAHNMFRHLVPMEIVNFIVSYKADRHVAFCQKYRIRVEGITIKELEVNISEAFANYCQDTGKNCVNCQLEVNMCVL